MIAIAQMQFASDARLSQLFHLAIQSRFVCMPLSGHLMDIWGRVLVHQTGAKLRAWLLKAKANAQGKFPTKYKAGISNESK